MDVPPGQVSEKELPPPPPPRPALITPSLSPPRSRISHHIPDRPPPPKRARTSATPSSSASTGYSSEQHPSLFAFWDQLAERYNKSLDEDDIVDLRELKFLKDRGVTRSAPQVYEIGCFTGAGEGSSEATEGEESEGEEGLPEEESSDELDLLDSLQRYKDARVPPADATNPEDAEAFREFEEAERRRRELFGDEEEEDHADDQAGVARADAATDDGEDADVDDGQSVDHSSSSVTHTDDTGEVERVLSPSPVQATPRRKSKSPTPLVADDASEDELATWEIDDTPIPPRRFVAPADDIIDLTLSRSPSPVRPPRARSKSQSRAPSRAATRARSQSRSRARATSLSRAQKPAQTPRRPPPPLQLLTPPRSSCSVPDPSPTAHDDSIRDETPSPTLPRPRPRYVPKPRSPESSRIEDGSDGSSTKAAAALPLPEPPNSARKTPKPRMHVEVIISTSTPKSKQAQRKARDSSPEVPLSRGLHLQRGDGSKTTSSAAERENRSPPPYPPTIKPQPVASSSRQSQPPPTRTVDESCSPQPKAPRGRKRRRVSSSPSEDEDEAPEKVIAPSRSLSVGSRKLSRRTVKPAPGYHSDAVPPTSSPVRSNDEDDAPLACDDRYRSRARSEAPIPPFPLYPPVYHPFPPRQPELSASSGPADRAESAHPPHHPYPPMAPHASHLLAWMSYFMASGALPPLPPPSHPPPAPGFHHDVPFPSHGYPSTPSRGRHHSDQSHHRTFGTPSSEAGPSHSSAYSTPAHYSHAYPSWFDPGYSSGTLPPSSPIPSSVMDSSPSLRPASVPPGQRSKSRGRRVSFKLDGNVRALSPTPSRDRQNNEESEEHYDAHASDDQHDYARGRSRSRGRRENTPMLPKNGKGKGKARAVSPSGESDDDGDEERKEPAERTVPDRGRPPPRARTPGPPSRREQSVPRGSGTTKEKGPAKKK